MAKKFPYVSGGGPIIQIVEHLRKSFPAVVKADTLQKLGLAPNNESYVINTLRFVGVIDDEGKKVPNAGKVFAQHDEAVFHKEFAGLVKEAYKDLFALHADEAWTLNQDQLIQFFRSSDETSAIVGKRQATTFMALSSLSGHAATPAVKRTPAAKKTTKRTKPANAKQDKKKAETGSRIGVKTRDVGLTVRVEINLPAEGDQSTYDKIFKSIRANLLDAE